MNTQKKFLKVLSMLTIILLIATIFIPGNGNRNAVASIGILGILLLFLSTLLPKIYKLTLNLLKNQGKTSPWSSLKSSEPVSETEELLWRQISYQITDKLQAAFPNATWEFQKPPSMKQLLCGNPIRLRTFHTEDYNFAEARMNQYGYLELQMLTIASLKKTVTVTDEDDVPFADPESWYSLIGKKKLENTSLEEQLEYVEQEIRTKESDLKELRHKAKEIQKEIEEKQKDELFKALVASGKTIDEVMRFIKATGEDKIE